MVDKLSAQLAGRLSFEYNDPTPGFDRSKVKGLVAKLVTVKDAAHSTALEVVAGGKLYQARKKTSRKLCTLSVVDCRAGYRVYLYRAEGTLTLCPDFSASL